MTKKAKKEAYQLSLKQIDAILENESHMILKMATINCILKENFPFYFWTGFYLVNDGELIVGPYQGTLGCLHIAFGKGVCGTAAQEKKTQIVKDVNKFPGHIACDSRSASEIVVPVFNDLRELIAVFDVDSTEVGSFDEIDKEYLEQLFAKHFASIKQK
ncbi:MAG TPA: GAF domain-containing protein [Candidatus Saccharimonadales bacterium]|nr:GAF domain-containing protein [Candidatus Saccharimonadales bacterium]